jgi:hypothetical protein
VLRTRVASTGKISSTIHLCYDPRVPRFLECCGPRAARFWVWLHAPSPTDWLLAAAGVGGVIAAIYTLLAIRREVRITGKAARASQRSAAVAERSLRLLNQPWLDTTDWTVTPLVTNEALQMIELSFAIVNNSKTPAILNKIQLPEIVRAGPEPLTRLEIRRARDPVGILLTPGGRYDHSEFYGVTAAHAKMYAGDGVIFDFEGTIHFSDMFTRSGSPGQRGPRRRHFTRRIWVQRDAVQIRTRAERIESDDDEQDRPQD